jgi:hypothetical protein
MSWHVTKAHLVLEWCCESSSWDQDGVEGFSSTADVEKLVAVGVGLPF